MMGLLREYVQFKESGEEMGRFKFAAVYLFLSSRFGPSHLRELSGKLLRMEVGDEKVVGIGCTYMRRVK